MTPRPRPGSRPCQWPGCNGGALYAVSTVSRLPLKVCSAHRREFHTLDLSGIVALYREAEAAGTQLAGRGGHTRR